MSEFFSTYESPIVYMVLEALLGLSLYLPLMAGQLSLASPGFYALGGYIAAILSTKVFPSSNNLFPIPFLLLEMIIAGIVSGILAVLVGIPALRLRGIYLAIATIAFVEVLRVVSLNLDITGGAVGIFGIPQPFQSQLEYLKIALPLLLISMVLFYRLERIRTGRAFIAIREDELAASAMGINPTYYKVLAFTLGAILAGIVGVITAHFLNTWNARQGTFDASITYLTIVLIGGSRTFLGSVVGAIVLKVLLEIILRRIADIGGLPIWLAQFLRDGRLMIFGCLIVLGTIFFPQGFVTPDILKKSKKQLLKLFFNTSKQTN
ncbi:MAG: branched-chain amino acid ABC transporter permease [Nostoc sp. ZfuVER08]|jgi:branched-chain amino acid transport system permease protein|uniref:Branched-chain amino acid ABC transporter permease n=1 Tax=Nostoc punctiforme FACHB-252 TaxID=1357509 RepID=A0ABR8HI83_NOSPU|nr:branched-chain amino acid ABC transporter permease [Nostoc punctiforme]MBD2615558.1 branched-chain amino acid ABC transporter permease [Nostoc punctiforme FACHB-252]MBL1203376.1 branched-chain amino acid ABC transporter permease [Nostoc sp. GBBB01]MDZ8015527.1 branched-chain amino acid ABC transporter permease [Nostoc sp. ZfuVER08]